MKIVSLNVWGGRLYQPLIDYLKAVDADVYCLQEVTRAPDATGDWLVYRDGDVVLDQRARLYDDIAMALPDHDGLFAPALCGNLFDDDRPCRQFFGLATFVRKRLPVIGHLSHFVHGQLSPDGFGPHPRARNGLAIRMLDTADRPMTIVQMHGLRDPVLGKRDAPVRWDQAIKLQKLIQSIAEIEDGVVVCGDFNLEPDSATFGLLREDGLEDLVTSRGFSDTRTSHYPKPGRHANYMLVNAQIAVGNFEVVAEPEVSDHRALVLDIP